MGTARHVADMEAMIAGFEALLSTEVPADFAALQRQRVALVRGTGAFLNGERERLAGISGGERLYAALVDLRMRYSGHITDWDGARVAAEWSHYREESAGLIASVRALISAGEALPRAA